MKIIALSVPGPTPDPKKMDELAGEEARNAWELLKADVVREAYLRKDKPGVVVVLEASTVEAAETAIYQLGTSVFITTSRIGGTMSAVTPIHREPELLGQTVVVIGGSAGIEFEA